MSLLLVTGCGPDRTEAQAAARDTAAPAAGTRSGAERDARTLAGSVDPPAARPAREPVELAPPFDAQGGHAYWAKLPVDWPSDDAEAQRSQLVVLEDGLPLGPGHALHDTIRSRGGGAYSHWDGGLYFSTRDDSDPNGNGRHYAVAWRGRPGLFEDDWRPLPAAEPFAHFPGGRPPPLAAATRAESAPATVWIHVIDALRADAVDARVGDVPVMPALSAFAAQEAVRFTHAYACSSFTKTSTATLFTGLWPQHHRALHGVLPTWPDGVALVAGLDPRFTTLADALAAVGYDTRSHAYSVHVRPGDGLLAGFRALDLAAGADEPFPGDPPAPGTPLFAYEHVLGVHGPYHPSDAARAALGLPSPTHLDPATTEWFGRPLDPDDLRELREAYLAAARDADGRLARRLEGLRASGRWDDALVIVTADHGEAFLEHGATQHTTSLFEEAVRVPLLVKFPAASPFAALHGRRFDQRVSLADLMPTLLELTGAPAPPYALDGKSLLPILRDEEHDPVGRPVALRSSFSDTAPDGSTRLLVQDALVAGRFKAIVGSRLQDAQGGAEAFARGDWLARLYDLAADPGEAADLAPGQPGTLRALMSGLAALGAPLLAPGTDAAQADHRSNSPAEPLPAGLDPDLEARLRALGYLR